MQIIPPSVEPTPEDRTPQSGRRPRRRLIFLGGTAAVASGLGIGLGSALRFQMPASQAPLFKPQQHFPPLAKWPPQIPLASERDFLDTDWEAIPSPHRLVYNAPSSEELEDYELEQDVYSDETQGLERDIILEENISNPIPTTVKAPDITDDGFEPELSSVVSTHAEDRDNESAPMDELQIDNTSDPSPDIDAWFDKRPISETQFSDGPVIIAPNESILSPEGISD